MERTINGQFPRIVHEKDLGLMVCGDKSRIKRFSGFLSSNITTLRLRNNEAIKELTLKPRDWPFEKVLPNKKSE